MAQRIIILLGLVTVLLCWLLSASAPVSGAHGARHRLAAADGGSERRLVGVVVEQQARDGDAVAAGRWSATAVSRKGGGSGHGRGRRGHGRGRGHGTPETPSVPSYPRTAGNGNYRHGRSSAAATTTAGPAGWPAAARAELVAAALLLLLRLRL